jgi:hypothetical protein
MAKRNGRNGPVGYKRPPAHTRFTKGRSGNPKGRPKGARGVSALANLVNRTVTVTVDGTRCQVPMGEALTLSLFQRALTGNVPAAREVMKIIEKVAEEQKAIEEAPHSIYAVKTVIVDPKACNISLQDLGVIEKVGDCWRIRTWVVEAAFARDNQLVLKESDRILLANSMVDPKKLRTILARAA